jgi:hypothetical protein
MAHDACRSRAAVDEIAEDDDRFRLQTASIVGDQFLKLLEFVDAPMDVADGVNDRALVAKREPPPWRSA